MWILLLVYAEILRYIVYIPICIRARVRFCVYGFVCGLKTFGLKTTLWDNVSLSATNCRITYCIGTICFTKYCFSVPINKCCEILTTKPRISHTGRSAILIIFSCCVLNLTKGYPTTNPCWTLKQSRESFYLKGLDSVTGVSWSYS